MKKIKLLDTLITSKTRVKLLIKFFLNAATRDYLRGLTTEFGESSNSIRVELNRLEGAGILESNESGNKRIFQANRHHPLFQDITSIVRKYVGVDQIIENIALRLGTLDQVYLTGPIVNGIDNGIIQIVLIGNSIDRTYLAKLAERAEEIIEKKISYICFESEAFETFQSDRKEEFFLIWDKNK